MVLLRCSRRGYIPTGLLFAFRLRYILVTILPLLEFALEIQSCRVPALRTPIAIASVAIINLFVFSFAFLMLATPIIAMLPIDRQ